MTLDTTQPGVWDVVIPVKRWAGAKTRLGRPELAWPFLRDCAAAVVGARLVDRIAIVTSEPAVGEWATHEGFTLVTDQDCVGINDAIAEGARVLRRGSPARPVAAFVSDLPCLTPAAVDALLQAASGYQRSFLADADGLGTTAWCTTAPGEIATAFGADSRSAHRRAGAVDLVGSLPDVAERLACARRDVDTSDDLSAAIMLGVGPHTQQLLTQQFLADN